MNPWEILGWVAAVCLSLVLVALTIAVVVATVTTTRRPRRGPKEVFRGREE